mmetsp:Transcript_5947/g.11619  ORF Transcript_5947/g.11619 Transcript_5947/m.11619 type:complete len:260 (+) Transcript_5947:136-915(+)
MGNCRMPNGFSIEHDVASPDVWESIQKWLSTNMLPSYPEPSTPITATLKTGNNYMTEISSESEHKNELIEVPIPWETGRQMQQRKVAQFGNCNYDYVADIAVACEGDDSNSISHPIPEYIRRVLLRPDKIEDTETYTQCIINLYEAENEIPWHIDHEYFGEKVLVYTFGEERPLLFRKKNNGDNSLDDLEDDDGGRENLGGEGCDSDSYVYSVSYPRHCSMYLLKGGAREIWEHSAPCGLGQRVSITFRSWRGPRECCK